MHFFLWPINNNDGLPYNYLRFCSPQNNLVAESDKTMEKFLGTYRDNVEDLRELVVCPFLSFFLPSINSTHHHPVKAGRLRAIH